MCYILCTILIELASFTAVLILNLYALYLPSFYIQALMFVLSQVAISLITDFKLMLFCDSV